jgi:hypothetical protein
MDRAELEQILSNGSRPHSEAIEEAIERLHRERWSLYMRLIPAYFSERARPDLVEVWRSEASESVARRLALADHEEALEFMLAHLNGAGKRSGL